MNIEARVKLLTILTCVVCTLLIPTIAAVTWLSVDAVKANQNQTSVSCKGYASRLQELDKALHGLVMKPSYRDYINRTYRPALIARQKQLGC